jgi:hypothetical protein
MSESKKVAKTRQPRKTKKAEPVEVLENKTFEELCAGQDVIVSKVDAREQEQEQEQKQEKQQDKQDTDDEPTDEEVNVRANTRVNKHTNDRQGKTYSRNEITNNRYNKKYEPRQNTSCLDFSYDDCLNDNENKTMKSCNIETHIKYMIALSHREGPHRRALYNVLKNTLTGLNGETNLPLSTTDERRKPFNSERRPNTNTHRSTSVRQRRNYNE